MIADIPDSGVAIISGAEAVNCDADRPQILVLSKRDCL